MTGFEPATSGEFFPGALPLSYIVLLHERTTSSDTLDGTRVPDRSRERTRAAGPVAPNVNHEWQLTSFLAKYTSI